MTTLLEDQRPEVAAVDGIGPRRSAWSDRPYLDGLRMVAVYLVVAFHAELALFEGGFIGVDLFFVLSGYLVTTILLLDVSENGRVRLARFYARRSRRLIPAAAVTIVGTSVMMLAVAPLIERQRFADDATSASLWFANWHFISENSQYFNEDGPVSPFLHFWSLSIEEQYYVVFPLLVAVVFRRSRRLRMLGLVVAVGLASSVVAQWYFARIDVDRAYLGTDTRAYQILAGSLLAIALWRAGQRRPEHRRGRVSSGLVVFGLLAALVVAATSTISPSSSTRGFVAAIVSVALICSLEVFPGTGTAKVLSLPVFTYLGRISYGTYLWHWPILVVARDLLDLSPVAALLLAVTVGTALAGLSAELVETGIRRSRRLDEFPRATVVAGVASALVVGLVVAPAILRVDRDPVVRPTVGVDLDASAPSVEPVPDVDFERLLTDRPDYPPCDEPDGADCFVDTNGEGTILMIGDSHSRMLIPAFGAIAADLDMSLAIDFGPSCPWHVGVIVDPGSSKAADCTRRRELTYGERLAALRPEVVVVASYPVSLLRSPMGAIPEWDELDPDELTVRSFDVSLDAILDVAETVVVVEPLPVLRDDPLSCLSSGLPAARCVFPSFGDGLEDSLARVAAASRPGVVALDLDELTCPDESACVPVLGGVVVRRDRHHLTNDFVEAITPAVADLVMAALDR